MRILGVLDLAGDRAVHARGGRREQYAPVRAVAGMRVEEGDAVAVARAYVSHFGIDELYVADLDAIMGGASQAGLVATLADVAPLWVDAGVTSVAAARSVAAAGASRIVVGLETLASFDALAEIAAAIGRERLAFSLDLRDGQPVHRMASIDPSAPPHAVAASAASAGATAIIVLDLARVGTRTGIDTAMLASVRDAVPGVTLMAGGGVGDLDHLTTLSAAGCDGALVATALLDGRITVSDVAAARRLQASVSR